MRFAIPVLATALMLGTGALSMADETGSLGSELKNEMGSMASEAKGAVQAEQEQMRDNFKAKKLLIYSVRKMCYG